MNIHYGDQNGKDADMEFGSSITFNVSEIMKQAKPKQTVWW